MILKAPWSRSVVEKFRDRDHLITALLTSAHVPLVMNGRVFRWLDGWPSFDGSILASHNSLKILGPQETYLTLEYWDDVSITCGAWGWLKLGPPEHIVELIQAGYDYARRRHTEGVSCMLEPRDDTLTLQ